MPLRKAKKRRRRGPLGPEIKSMRIENQIYHVLAVFFGAVGVVLGVVITLDKFAEFFLHNLIPEKVRLVVIACAVIAVAISLVSGYLHSLHQLEFLHDSVEVLVKQIDLQRIFTFNVNEDRLASVAVKKAAAEYVQYISDMRNQIEHIDNPDAPGKSGTILKDWSLISVFVRQLINTLGEQDNLCVWMGVSLVTNNEGWDAQNDVVYHFDAAIRQALGQEILDRVYRVYYIDPSSPNCQEIAGRMRQSILRDHGISSGGPSKSRRIVGYDHLKLHLSTTTQRIGEVQDVSFIWVNKDITNNKRVQLPDPTWRIERLQQEGWQLVLALEWVIRNNFLVDHVVIHSENEGWVDEHHRKLGELWKDSKAIVHHQKKDEAGDIRQGEPQV
jgi:hypothetical protein